MVHSLHLFSKEENCVKGSAWLWWTYCLGVHIFYLIFIMLAVFILKESKFEAVFFEAEVRGWSLQLSLLPMQIHIPISYAWKIRALCNNLEIKLFCSWCINCDIHPEFSIWFWPVPWGTFKKSLALEWYSVGNLCCTCMQWCSTLPQAVGGMGKGTFCCSLSALCWGRSADQQRPWEGVQKGGSCCSPRWSGVSQATETVWRCWLWEFSGMERWESRP